jgi:hypothetical protein
MTVNPTRVSQADSEAHRPTTAEIIERLSRFDGPPEQFLVNLLAVQCHLASAAGGAILRVNPSGGAEVLAVYPQLSPSAAAPVWLAQSAESASQVAAGGRPAVRPLHGPDDLYGAPANQNIILLPLRGGSGVQGLAAFLATTGDPRILAATRERLELTVSLLSLYEMRLTLQQRQGDLARLRLAMETTAAVNEQDRFAGAAMALCNEVSSRWKCDRVCLGFLKGRYVHLKAMSHTEKFSRKMKVVQDIESAMEETLDQDVEVTYPAGPEATFVQRAAAELSKRHGPTAVLSLPLRHEGQAAAVITLERPIDQPFALGEIEALRLTIDLVSPRLAPMHLQDRWIGARAGGSLRKGLATILGPKHTWIKVAGVAVFAAVLFLTLAKGDYRAEAPFVLEPVAQRVVPAPFEGFLKQVYVRPGDRVVGAGAGERPNWLLNEEAVTDWPSLLAVLRGHDHEHGNDGPITPACRISAQLPEPTRRAIMAATTDNPVNPMPDGSTEAPLELRKTVLDGLNAVMASACFYDPNAWAGVELSDRQRDLLSLGGPKWTGGGQIEGDRLIELNRSLLASTCPGAVRPGPTVLGTLETTELKLELKSAEAQWLGYRKQVDAAMREDKRSDAQIAQAQADQVEAKMKLLSHRIAHSVMVSSIDGCVVSGDLRKQLGAPVKTGDVLFEVAALADLRAELAVPEDLITDVQAALERRKKEGKALGGALAATARPDEHIDFVVERINPVAEVVKDNNVFKVRVRLLDTPSIFRPGMEGVGKIDIDRRSYGFIWTRRMINWVRMKLWI